MFKREERYIVIKKKDLDLLPVGAKEGVLMMLGSIPKVDCLVIESDWPEYEPTWSALENRVSNKVTCGGVRADGSLL